MHGSSCFGSSQCMAVGCIYLIHAWWQIHAWSHAAAGLLFLGHELLGAATPSNPYIAWSLYMFYYIVAEPKGEASNRDALSSPVCIYVCIYLYICPS